MSLLKRAKALENAQQQSRLTRSFEDAIHATLSQPLILDTEDNTVGIGTRICVDAQTSNRQMHQHQVSEN